MLRVQGYCVVASGSLWYKTEGLCGNIGLDQAFSLPLKAVLPLQTVP